MAQAAKLALRGGEDTLSLAVHDSATDLSAAAKQASAADVILGPLFGRDLVGVRQILGPGKPIVSFSNDARMAGPETFVMGIGPEHSVEPILRYARGQGVRRLAVVTSPGPLGNRAVGLAETSSRKLGLNLVGRLFLPVAGDPQLLQDSLRDACGGTLPDAVLLPDGGQTLAGFAAALSGSGVQLLGTAQWSTQALAPSAALSGAWFPAPDPSGYAWFVENLALGGGAQLGVLAALAHDATMMAKTLVDSGQLTVQGIQRAEGFSGITGRFRFLPDGRSQRDLAIFAIDSSGPRVVQPALQT